MTERRSFEDQLLAKLIAYQPVAHQRVERNRARVRKVVASIGVVAVVAALSSSFLAHTSTTPSFALAAAHSAEALQTIGKQKILHVTQPFPSGDVRGREIWTDQSDLSSVITVDRAIDGSILGEFGERIVGNRAETLEIDHRSRTYHALSLPTSNDGSDSSEATSAGGTFTPSVSAFTPSGIVKAYKNDVLQVRGEEEINGMSRIRVDEIIPDDGNHLAKSRVWWIDKNTFLPVQMTMETVDGSPSMTFTYEWLDRNSENLAKLWPSVPSGYQEQ